MGRPSCAAWPVTPSSRTCIRVPSAREHLAAEGETVDERDATQSEAWRAELMSYTNNRGIVPTIIWDDGRRQVGFPPGRG